MRSYNNEAKPHNSNKSETEAPRRASKADNESYDTASKNTSGSATHSRLSFDTPFVVSLSSISHELEQLIHDNASSIYIYTTHITYVMMSLSQVLGVRDRTYIYYTRWTLK